jgi:hypothetical protein
MLMSEIIKKNSRLIPKPLKYFIPLTTKQTERMGSYYQPKTRSAKLSMGVKLTPERMFWQPNHKSLCQKARKMLKSNQV